MLQTFISISSADTVSYFSPLTDFCKGEKRVKVHHCNALTKHPMRCDKVKNENSWEQALIIYGCINSCLAGMWDKDKKEKKDIMRFLYKKLATKGPLPMHGSIQSHMLPLQNKS